MTEIPALAKTNRVLFHAIMSLAARHLRDTNMAETAYALCIEDLIPRLASDNVAEDEILLCTIVILRVFEQLDG